MNVETIKPAASTGTNKGARSDSRFPAYALKDCVVVPEAIHKNGGGSASTEHLIAFLGYKSATNGAYLARVGAAKAFGLIAKSGNVLVPTALAHRIISPVYPEDAKKALVDAFFEVSLFKQIYEDFKGRELPPEMGMKNALRNAYGILPTRVDLAYRIFIESAEYAGFFATRGARTHLVIPAFSPQQPADQIRKPDEGNANDKDDRDSSGGGSGGGDDGGSGGDGQSNQFKPSATLEEMKAKYLNSLITLLEAKSAKGDVDEKLMERIERLLDSKG